MWWYRRHKRCDDTQHGQYEWPSWACIIAQVSRLQSRNFMLHVAGTVETGWIGTTEDSRLLVLCYHSDKILACWI